MQCLAVIEAESPERRKVSHAFHKKRSIVTNARAHCGRRYVLNMDLKDFFGTINFGRVRGFFMVDRSFQLTEKVATIIAQIVCHENALPQGAPSSPVVSNLIGHILDCRLIRLARDYGCTYTRYADDLTFSTNRKTFPRVLARKRLGGNDYSVGRKLKKAIKVSGFSINLSKTRLQFRVSRQEATGLVVNEKVNIAQDYYRDTRSMCFSLFQTGSYFHPGADPTQPISTLAPLEGRLAHIYHVKYVTERRKEKQLDHRLVGYQEPKGPKLLYRRFLFYKHFIANEVPVLVTEGKTDIIYLRAAIKARQAKFPELATLKDGKSKLQIQFLNASTNNKAVLGLAQGYPGMTAALKSYDKTRKAYGFRPLSHPVIFVVDNDDGGKNVVSAAQDVSLKALGTTFDPASGQPFYYVRDNLYLVQTPAGANGEPSAIEDCFPQNVLDEKLNGKSFDPKKKHGDDTTFGKAIFAEQIVRSAADKIDFSGFDPILAGISQAIADYQAKLDAAAQAAAKKSA